MDLSTSDYVATIEEGRELELVHPGTKRKFSSYGGSDLFVKVLGIDAPAVEVAKRDAQREILRSQRADDEASPSRYEIRIACAATVDFKGGEGEVSTLDDFRHFMETHPDGVHYARQILRFAENTSVFFDKR